MTQNVLIKRSEGFFLRAKETLNNLIGPSKKGQNSAETSKNFFTMEYGRLIDHGHSELQTITFDYFTVCKLVTGTSFFPSLAEEKKHLETHSKLSVLILNV